MPENQKKLAENAPKDSVQEIVVSAKDAAQNEWAHIANVAAYWPHHYANYCSHGSRSGYVVPNVALPLPAHLSGLVASDVMFHTPKGYILYQVAPSGEVVQLPPSAAPGDSKASQEGGMIYYVMPPRHHGSSYPNYLLTGEYPRPKGYFSSGLAYGEHSFNYGPNTVRYPVACDAARETTQYPIEFVEKSEKGV